MADHYSDSSDSSSLATDAGNSLSGEEEREWSSSSSYDNPTADTNMYSSDESSSSSGPPDENSSTSISSDSSDETSSTSISSDSECDTDDLETSVTDPDLNHECGLSSMKEFRTPLYDGAELSVLDSHLLMYQYALRHCITTQAFTELINLVETHMPRNSRAVSSLYKLRKFFEENFNDTKCQVYEYCSKCHRLLIDSETTGVPCSSGCEGASVNKFIYVPVESQLKKKLEDPFLWAQLQKRFGRDDNDTIRDIFDGQEYKKLVHSGFLSQANRANVSFTLNTDGVDVYRSSKYSIWPIWLQINELPPAQRYSKQNMLLCGLWYDNEKPTMTTFLYPLMSALNQLFVQGIDVNSPHGPTKAHGVLLLFCVDLPAQAKLLNMKQYNGKFGCAMCEDEGVARPGAHMQRNWPCTPNCTLRIHTAVKCCAQEAAGIGKAVKGIKGASILFLHKPFNVVKGVGIDSLHIIFLGVVSDLLKYWFDKQHRTSAYSIFSKRKQCDNRLLAIKVPDIISRPPRSLEDYSHWKGAQLREWLLYYSVPVLHDILPSSLFNHYCYLVAGVHIILADCITEVQIDCADSCFHEFYSQFSANYGPNADTMKVHLLRHVTSCVRNWGPLWAYSAFQFEGMNHCIKKLFHGSRNTSKELAFNYTMLQCLPPIICMRNSTTKDKVQVTLDKMRGKYRKHTENGLLGGVEKFLSSEEVHLLNQSLVSLDLPPTVSCESRYTIAFRLVHEGAIYYSAKYKRVKSRNSYTIVFKDACDTTAYGQIQFFVLVSNSVFAYVKKFEPLAVSCQAHFHLSHQSLDVLSASNIVPVKSDSEIDVFIPASSLVSKCIFVSITDSSNSCNYIISFPNKLLYD